MHTPSVPSKEDNDDDDIQTIRVQFEGMLNRHEILLAQKGVCLSGNAMRTPRDFRDYYTSYY